VVKLKKKPIDKIEGGRKKPKKSWELKDKWPQFEVTVERGICHRLGEQEKRRLFGGKFHFRGGKQNGTSFREFTCFTLRKRKGKESI